MHLKCSWTFLKDIIEEHQFINVTSNLASNVSSCNHGYWYQGNTRPSWIKEGWVGGEVNPIINPRTDTIQKCWLYGCHDLHTKKYINKINLKWLCLEEGNGTPPTPPPPPKKRERRYDNTPNFCVTWPQGVVMCWNLILGLCNGQTVKMFAEAEPMSNWAGSTWFAGVWPKWSASTKFGRNWSNPLKRFDRNATRQTHTTKQKGDNLSLINTGPPFKFKFDLALEHSLSQSFDIDRGPSSVFFRRNSSALEFKLVKHGHMSEHL